MSFWRKCGLIIASSLLPLLLFAWGLTFSAYNVYGTPDRIKHALDASGIYNTFVNDILAQGKKYEEQGSGGKIPLDRPDVKRIIQDAAPPSYLKAQVEGFLDDMYAWIQGETEQLQLEINLNEVKTKLTEGLVAHATNRLNSLPVCAGPVNAQDFDPLSAECIPRGLDKNAAVEKVKAEADKIFEDPVLTQADIKNKEGQTLEQQLQAAPQLYNNIKSGLWLGAVLILLLAAGIVFVSKPWQAGLRRVGIICVTVGASSSLIALAVVFVLKTAIETLSSQGDLQANAVNVVRFLAEDFRTWWLGFGITVLLLGIAALVSQRFTTPKAADPETPSGPNVTEKTTPRPKAASRKTVPPEEATSTLSNKPRV